LDQENTPHPIGKGWTASGSSCGTESNYLLLSSWIGRKI
jgi:hypothetical protein